VYNNFPIELILEIGVISEEMKTEVEGILRFFEKEIKVEVASDWYY
jgi:C4-type Zn-finger protein